MTDYEEEVEVSDAELLKEIEREALLKNDTNNINNNTNYNDTNINLNDTINNNNNNDNNINNNENNKYDGGAIAPWQDNIITTGSDVSILLMVILLILFIIQMMRKTYNYFTLQSQIQKVANPLDAAKPIAAENLTPINPGYDHKSYAVYNTEFEDRKYYLQKQAEGAQPSILRDILLKRAVKCIERARAMQRDGVGIRKNWNMDLLPRDVWEDFNLAQRNIQAEVECVIQENQRLGFNWGLPHRMNIFSKAKEIHEQKMIIQNKVYRQKMQIKQEQQQKQQQKQQKQKQKQAPHPNKFGKGLESGFFNNNNNTKSLTKKEKQELKRQKKQMGKTSNQQPTMQKNNIENPINSNNTQYQQTQPRRRKGKHRFTTK